MASGIAVFVTVILVHLFLFFLFTYIIIFLCDYDVNKKRNYPVIE
ncbi:hypothetical protein FM106_12725 [Brachybacterium faecium]|nr:hypothetical protein FM106_12725 [Brachybacterium faecium]